MNLPRDITEAELLALVEGDASSLGAREAEVRMTVAADPALMRLVAGMKADRTALASLPRVSAPAALLNDVEAVLEREALAGLVAGEPAYSPLPISSVVVSHRGALDRLWQNSGSRRLALAAMLLLAVGAGVWMTIAVLDIERLHQPRALARNAARGTERAPSPEVNAPDGVVPGPIVAVAPERPTTPDTDSPLGPAKPVAALATTNPGTTETAPPAVIESRKLTSTEALELARAGRLIIRIRATDVDVTARKVHELAQHTGKETRWRPADTAQAPLIAHALAAAEAPRPAPARTPDSTPPGTAADQSANPAAPPASPSRPLLSQPANTTELMHRYPDLRVLYTVELGQSDRDLASLAGLLTTGKDQVAEFVALDAPLPLPPSLDPGAILWWGRGPANWVKRTSVPVVVESQR